MVLPLLLLLCRVAYLLADALQFVLQDLLQQASYRARKRRVDSHYSSCTPALPFMHTSCSEALLPIDYRRRKTVTITGSVFQAKS
jgi:hypothetical protein